MSQAEINADTLDLLYTRSIDEPAYQAAMLENLDRKAAGFLSIGSVVLGFTAAATEINTWLLIAAVLAYLVLAIAAIRCLRPAAFHGRVMADTAWPTHWDQPANEVKHALVERACEDVADNRVVIGSKALAVHIAALALAGETLIVALAIIAART